VNSRTEPVRALRLGPPQLLREKLARDWRHLERRQFGVSATKDWDANHC
jgi:hypothetical protein